ncbi:MAG: CBS domain-containing protein [Desulfurococcales archaeon]|nr:CBS domain-containing protein [Desulfurococcales archaeon]
MAFETEEAGETLMLVRDIMSSPPVTVTPETTVQEVARLMSIHGIGSVVVVDKPTPPNKIVGIITDKDLIKRVLAPGKDPFKTKASDVMTTKVHLIYAQDTLRDAVYKMKSRGIGHLPVIDMETGQLVGMISKSDILLVAPEYLDMLSILWKRVPPE